MIWEQCDKNSSCSTTCTVISFLIIHCRCAWIASKKTEDCNWRTWHWLHSYSSSA